MGSEERLSTRDIASPSGAETDPQTDPRFERDTAATEPPPATDTPLEAEPVTEAPAGRSSADAVAPVPATGRGEETVEAPAERETRTGTAATDTSVSEAPSESAADREAPLLDDSDGLHSRWEEIQVRFVDEPRGAVEDADALVATVMQRLADGFAQEREQLEAQWGRGEDISTEDLRVALQRYRSFFRRLLAT
jgi:hypothetical protein